MTEVMRVSSAGDTTAAVMAAIGKNAPCGLCIMECIYAAFTEACAMACYCVCNLPIHYLCA